VFYFEIYCLKDSRKCTIFPERTTFACDQYESIFGNVTYIVRVFKIQILTQNKIDKLILTYA